MAEKMSVLVLKVDLGCCKCYNRIRKTLCQLHSEIRSQTWDIKQNIVIIAGPFDPQAMSKKIEYRAGKVVKGIEIKGGDAKPKQAPPADAKPDKPATEKADGGEKKADKKPPPAEKPAEKPPPAEKPAEKAAEAPKEAAAKPAAEMKMLEPMHTVVAYPVVQPPYGMYHEGYQHEGAPYYNYNGYNARPVYNYHGVNRGYEHGSDYFSEENPACTIM